MYVVLRVQMYYRSDILGVFTTRARAVAAMREYMAKNEVQSPHLELYYTEVNKLREVNSTCLLALDNDGASRVAGHIKKRTPHHDFAYKLLENDPMAIDLFSDVATRGK